MLSQIRPALFCIALIKHIEHRVDLTLNDFKIVIFDVSCQVAVVGLVVAGVLRCDHRQRMNRSGNRHIQHMGIVHKIRNHIVNRGQNDSVLFPSLKFVNCIHLISAAQLFPDGRHLIPIRRDNADALEILLIQPWKHFLLDDVYLALVEMPTGMITGSRPIHGQHIRFVMILRHDDQLSMIELLVAEVDDLRVTAVMLPQQRDGCILPCFQRRGKQAVG